MTQLARQEYAAALRGRYGIASKKQKGETLDEYCRITGCNQIPLRTFGEWKQVSLVFVLSGAIALYAQYDHIGKHLDFATEHQNGSIHCQIGWPPRHLPKFQRTAILHSPAPYSQPFKQVSALGA